MIIDKLIMNGGLFFLFVSAVKTPIGANVKTGLDEYYRVL